MHLETPVLFCVFNRPDLTRRVFDAIAQQRPRKLLLACDGPRQTKSQDELLVAETRAVLERIDWPCDVETFFRQKNQGCRTQMADAITWGFSRHERLIILEDDCLPGPSFFTFCEKLLDHYATDERVMMISGDNFQPVRRSERSYYFSNYAHIWGWASWRRAWTNYDLEMTSWPVFRDQELLREFACCDNEYHYWTDVFDRQHAGSIETWDYSWAFACWKHRGYTILPETNLVSNIGFRSDGTHTTDAEHHLANQPVGTVDFITHPSVVARDAIADEYTWRNVFCPPVLNREETVRIRKAITQRLTGGRAA